MENKNKKKQSIFLVALFLISIAFAYLLTDLVINGEVTVGSNTWDVHFENVVVDSGSVEATEPAEITSDTQVDFSVLLDKPGDYYKFTVDIVNEGTIDAMINEIVATELEDLPEYLDYTYKYSNGTIIGDKDLLASGSTNTIEIIVYYKEDIEPTSLPEDAETIPLSLAIEYVQADETAVNPFNK